MLILFLGGGGLKSLQLHYTIKVIQFQFSQFLYHNFAIEENLEFCHRWEQYIVFVTPCILHPKFSTKGITPKLMFYEFSCAMFCSRVISHSLTHFQTFLIQRIHCQKKNLNLLISHWDSVDGGLWISIRKRLIWRKKLVWWLLHFISLHCIIMHAHFPNKMFTNNTFNTNHNFLC